MKVSIITPTEERKPFLEGLFQLIQAQSYADWEWLIYDTSLRATPFQDPRIHYLHDSAIVSIGEKRNRLIERASGDVIVHFDDDDYYGPNYLALVVEKMREVAFFNLYSWFSYDTKTDQIYYWATDEQFDTQYLINPLSGARVREIELGPHLQNQREKLNWRGRTGYGFSYSYHRQAALTHPFPDCDYAEDRKFYEKLVAEGYPIGMEAEKKGEVIHVIHETNTSGEFPNYRIPRFLLEETFAPFFSYIAHVQN